MIANSRKRKPSDDLSDEQRFAKRFDLLNIGTDHTVSILAIFGS